MRFSDPFLPRSSTFSLPRADEYRTQYPNRHPPSYSTVWISPKHGTLCPGWIERTLLSHILPPERWSHIPKRPCAIDSRHKPSSSCSFRLSLAISILPDSISFYPITRWSTTPHLWRVLSPEFIPLGYRVSGSSQNCAYPTQGTRFSFLVFYTIDPLFHFLQFKSPPFVAKVGEYLKYAGISFPCNLLKPTQSSTPIAYLRDLLLVLLWEKTIIGQVTLIISGTENSHSFIRWR